MRQKPKSKLRPRQWLRKVIQSTMPRRVRHSLLRKVIDLDFDPSPRLKVRLARTKDELESALRLLHDSYVKAGLMTPHPSGLRVTKYHALPATATIIALWDDEVVGTVSLVRRSAFGMPLENIFDITRFTHDGSRIFETSSLAVDPRFSGQNGTILFPLIKFLFNYATDYFGSNYMAIAVNPSWIEFYEAIFNFQRLQAKPVDKYDFVNGASAVGAYLNLVAFKQMLKGIYTEAPSRKNMFNYIFKATFSNLEFPKRKFNKISDPMLTPEILDYLFNIRTQTFAGLSEREIFTLHQLYQNDGFRGVLPPAPPKSNVLWLREGTRFEVNIPGGILLTGNATIPMRITDISSGGIGVVTSRNLREGELYTLQVALEGEKHSLRNVQLRWTSPDRKRSGLKVYDRPQGWVRFVNLLTDDLLRQVG